MILLTGAGGLVGRELARCLDSQAVRLGLHGGQTVLDLACGPGTLTRLLADAVGSSGLVVGADLSAPMLDRAARTVDAPQVALARMDAMDLPLADGCVDAVCCSLCLHLVPHLETALDEILRVLDSMQLTARHRVATPANWKQGDDVIIAGSVSDEEAKGLYPQGWNAVKPYLRVVKQPQ